MLPRVARREALAGFAAPDLAAIGEAVQVALERRRGRSGATSGKP